MQLVKLNSFEQILKVLMQVIKENLRAQMQSLLMSRSYDCTWRWQTKFFLDL